MSSSTVSEWSRGERHPNGQSPQGHPGSEIASYAERFGDVEESTVTLAMRAHGLDMAAFPPVVVPMIVTSLARIVLLERGLGITRGHAEAEAFIEHCLERFELRPDVT
jgi:hypothetical protein